MDADFETPFPFCESCATWHEPDGCEEYARRHWQRVDRINFWYGWVWGAACTSGLLLVVRLIWIGL